MACWKIQRQKDFCAVATKCEESILLNRGGEHPVIAQLADIWTENNVLERLRIHTPPLFKHLPALMPDPAVELAFKPLFKAAGLKATIEIDATDFAEEDDCGLHALLKAAFCGRVDAVEVILSRTHETINQFGAGDTLPIVAAILRESVESSEHNIRLIQRLLATEKVDLNKGDWADRSPVSFSIKKNQREIYDMFCDTGQVNKEHPLIKLLLLEKGWT